MFDKVQHLYCDQNATVLKTLAADFPDADEINAIDAGPTEIVKTW